MQQCYMPCGRRNINSPATGWNGETRGANQRITVAEALAVNTINGAYNSHEEAVKGSISIGKLADFVVLSDDISTVNESKIKNVQIVRTVVGGNSLPSRMHRRNLAYKSPIIDWSCRERE
jgi:predicted amidohydrolase YtcJ